MRAGAPYVTVKSGSRTAQPVQRAEIDIVSPIGLIQGVPLINPGQQLGKAQFIEWQEAIGHE
jgi:hypothetical protein